MFFCIAPSDVSLKDYLPRLCMFVAAPGRRLGGAGWDIAAKALVAFDQINAWPL